MKTLLLALLSPEKSRGTREGAIKGLVGVGKEAVRKGLVEAGGAKVVGSECMPGEEGGLGDVVMDALTCLHPPSDRPFPLDASVEADQAVIARLGEVMGDFFANRLMVDSAWAKGVLDKA